MDELKKRKISKYLFCGLFILIPVVSVSYFLIDGIVTADWSSMRTPFAFFTCVCFLSGVMTALLIPMYRLTKSYKNRVESKMFCVSAVLIVVGILCYILTGVIFGR